MFTHNARIRSAAAMVLAGGLVLGASACSSPNAGSDDREVHVAAVLPLSGLYGANGKGELAGAQLAIDLFNEAGGVKSMSGAKVVLDSFDAGESIETAVTAATRAMGGDAKPAAGLGAWLSSFSLGVTEVAERQKVPWFTVGFADTITDRGFKYTYKVTPYSTQLAQGVLDTLARIGAGRGEEVKTIALVGDNTAAMVALFKAIDEGGLAAKAGVTIVTKQVWTPPLGNASSVAAALKDTNPDAIVFGGTNFTDGSAILAAMQEHQLDTVIVAQGQWMVMPEYINNVGAEKLEGIYSVVGGNASKGMEDVVATYMKESGQPFMTPDAIGGYLEASIILAAIEKAGSADPLKVNEAIKSLKITSGPATTVFPGGDISFDGKGMINNSVPVVVQWQGGYPMTVFPEKAATAAANY